MEIFKENHRSATDNELRLLYNKIIKLEKNIDEVLDNFNLQDILQNKNKFTFPIILRTGGIGDLIALSSISY